MGYGNTLSGQSQRPDAAEVGPARTALMWVAWTVAMAVVIAVALVCVPAVVVWCLLFDAD